MGSEGLEKAEAEDVVGLLAEIPDLWDFCLAGWENDSRTSRFGEEGGHESYLADFKRLTTKPVVGVGRYTSPDRMAAVIRKGLVDLIGCARPSISDPFLPRKVAEGRLEDIRECIGCNICVSGDFTMSPIRCTQNPTMGEEWRRGWHPEYIRPGSRRSPCSSWGRVRRTRGGPGLGKRGYAVTLAEKGREPGGRVRRESRLPGLAAWSRVAEYRVGQLQQAPQRRGLFRFGARRGGGPRIRGAASGARHRREMAVRRGRAPLDAADARRRGGGGADTGRRHGRAHAGGTTGPRMGRRPLLHGGVLAERLAEKGFETVYATPASEASTWTRNTMEQFFIQTRLLEKEVGSRRSATSIGSPPARPPSRASTPVGRRSWPLTRWCSSPRAHPWTSLRSSSRRGGAAWADAGIESVEAIGDACAPATIAHAVYAGRRYAEELDGPEDTGDSLPFRRELTELADD